jgi:hypothetical protein
VGVALFYLLDPELSAEDKVVTTVGVAAVPAVAFVAAAAPLLRESRNRLTLRGGAAFAWIAAFFQLMLTSGVASSPEPRATGRRRRRFEARTDRLKRVAETLDLPK